MSTQGDVEKQWSDGGSEDVDIRKSNENFRDTLSGIKARVAAAGSVRIDNGNEGKD